MWPGKYNALSTPVDICQIKSRARSKDPWHASARSPGASQSHSGCTVVFAVLAGLRPLGLGAVTAPWEQPTSISSHVKYLATFDSIEIELTEGSLGKFRSQTSDNMDRRKSRGGKSQRRVREEKRREEKRRREKRREEKRREEKRRREKIREEKESEERRCSEAWATRGGDKETEVPKWVKSGTPLGIQLPIGTCGIFRQLMQTTSTSRHKLSWKTRRHRCPKVAC